MSKALTDKIQIIAYPVNVLEDKTPPEHWLLSSDEKMYHPCAGGEYRRMALNTHYKAVNLVAVYTHKSVEQWEEGVTQFMYMPSNPDRDLEFKTFDYDKGFGVRSTDGMIFSRSRCRAVALNHKEILEAMLVANGVTLFGIPHDLRFFILHATLNERLNMEIQLEQKNKPLVTNGKHFLVFKER